LQSHLGLCKAERRSHANRTDAKRCDDPIIPTSTGKVKIQETFEILPSSTDYDPGYDPGSGAQGNVQQRRKKIKWGKQAECRLAEQTGQRNGEERGQASA
jgi:hypothetical protein